MAIHYYKLNKTTARLLVKEMLAYHLGLKPKWELQILETGKIGRNIRVLAKIGDMEYTITGKTYYSSFSLHDGYTQDEIFPIDMAQIDVKMPENRKTNVYIW